MLNVVESKLWCTLETHGELLRIPMHRLNSMLFKSECLELGARHQYFLLKMPS